MSKASEGFQKEATIEVTGGGPFGYWRTFGANEYGVVRRLQLACEVGAISTHDALWKRALLADAASSVAIALTMRIPTTITTPVDVRMSVLLNAALAGDAACAMVLANMLTRMPLERRLRERLSSSWRLQGTPAANYTSVGVVVPIGRVRPGDLT